MLQYKEYVRTSYKVGTLGSAAMPETVLSQQQHNNQLLRILSSSRNKSNSRNASNSTEAS